MHIRSQPSNQFFLDLLRQDFRSHLLRQLDLALAGNLPYHLVGCASLLV